MMQTMTSLKDTGIQTRVRSVFLRLLKDWDSHSALVTHGHRVRRRARGSFTSVLTLDEAVSDSEDGVNDHSINAFGDLVLYLVFVSFWSEGWREEVGVELTSTLTPSLFSMP